MTPPRLDAKRYHHGDLREALIDAARQLMEDQAHWTFTLREVARAAGVSHNAPYNHFADRRALLAAVATQGFAALTDALRAAAAADARADTPARIRAIAGAYVMFAVRNGARYRLMFSAELSGCDDAALRDAGETAFAVLRETIARGVAAGALRADPAGTHALTAWSLVHGVSTLILDGKVPAPADDEAVAALTHRLADTLFTGLSDPTPPARP
jgi:AcrR family transcriptional regulator